MFGFGKKAEFEREQRLAKRAAGENLLRERLNNLLDAIVDDLARAHNLRPAQFSNLTRISDQMRLGFDYVLIHQIDAFDPRIPEECRTGASIASSVHSWFFLAANLGQFESCEIFATGRDQQTVGDIRWLLGFARDGMTVREGAPENLEWILRG